MVTKKILVIDYDQNSLASLDTILTKHGYRVVTASDGQSGWDKYNKESPDLVLLEAMLPKVHGFELCQRITSERNSQATVFIMTGVYKDRVYRTEALRTYGASEYFEKPLKMTELLASIEAVLGKPEPRPEVEPLAASPAAGESAQAGQGRDAQPKPVPVEPRKREKRIADDVKFTLPADLDQLSREIPARRKPAPGKGEMPAQAKSQSLADELLKKVVSESGLPGHAFEEKAAGGNGNGNGDSEIDHFLKSALAGLDLTTEKVKVPKTAPLPPPPVPSKSKPTPAPPSVPEKHAEEKPKPRPAPHPEDTFSAPFEPAPRSTLTPGDPGSDTSPFAIPEKPKAESPAEKAAVLTPPAHPASVIPSPKPPKPVARPAAKPEPVKHEVKASEAEAIAAASLFEDISAARTRKGISPIILVGAAVVIVAVAGYLVLKPKRAALVDNSLITPQTIVPASVPEQPAEEAPPPEVKREPVKPKAQPKAKAEDPGPAIEAIMPAASPSAALPLGGTQGDAPSGGQDAAESVPGPAVPPPGKTEATTAPAGTEEKTTQPAATDPGIAASGPAPAAVPVKEGDLVNLGSVSEPPKLLKSVDPAYPPAAQRLGIGGSITVNALIDEKGNVIDTGILKGIQDDQGLAKAAEAAVKKWKFQPARKNGVPVKVWKPFVIAFKPEEKKANSTE